MNKALESGTSGDTTGPAARRRNGARVRHRKTGALGTIIGPGGSRDTKHVAWDKGGPGIAYMADLEALDAFPLRTISARDVYADALGNWVVMDDNPESDQVLLIPLPFEHRQLVTRAEAVERLKAKP